VSLVSRRNVPSSTEPKIEARCSFASFFQVEGLAVLLALPVVGSIVVQ